MDLDVEKLVNEAIEADNGPILGEALPQRRVHTAVERSETAEAEDAAEVVPSTPSEPADAEVVETGGSDAPEVETTVAEESHPLESPEIAQDATRTLGDGLEVEEAQNAPEAVVRDPEASDGEPDAVVDLEAQLGKDGGTGGEVDETDLPPELAVPMPELFRPGEGDTGQDVGERTLEPVTETWLPPVEWEMPQELQQWMGQPMQTDELKFDTSDTLAGQGPVVDRGDY